MSAEAVCKAVKEHLNKYGIDENLISGKFFCPQEIVEEDDSQNKKEETQKHVEVKKSQESKKPEKLNERQSAQTDTPNAEGNSHLLETPEAKITDIAMISANPVWSTEQAWSMFSVDILNEYIASGSSSPHIGADGTSVQINTVPFHFPFASVGTEPALFSLVLANIGTTESPLIWKLYTSPPRIQSRGMPRNPRATASPVVDPLSELDDPDFIRLVWMRKLRNEEILAKQHPPQATNPMRTTQRSFSKPSTQSSYVSGSRAMSLRKSFRNIMEQQQQQQNVIQSGEMFKILPCKGHIVPGDSQELTFKFSYAHVGCHKWFVLLRIYPDIFIWIDLEGRTLTKDTPAIQFMHKKKFSLHPIPISNLDPPAQLFRMYNGSSVDAHYTVNLHPFMKLRDENFGHDVISVGHECGTIPPFSWSSLPLSFSPIEYKDYKADLIINGPEGTCDPVQIHGTPCLSSVASLRPDLPTYILPKFVIFNPIVPMSITPNHITFAHFIATGHRVSRMIFMKNLSHTNKISFAWATAQIPGGGRITFSPHSGVVEPQKSAAVLVTLVAGGASVTFTETARCLIEDETANAMYDCLYNEWEKSTALGLISTCSVGNGGDGDVGTKKVTNAPEKPERFSLLLGVTAYIGSAFGAMNNLLPKEKIHLPSPEPVCQPVRFNKEQGFNLKLSPTMVELTREIMTGMLWDIVYAEDFEKFVRLATKRQAPFFSEYKESYKSIQSKEGSDTNCFNLPKRVVEEILELSIFNMMQELAANWSLQPEHKWYELPKVQPQAMVEVERFKSCFR